MEYGTQPTHTHPTQRFHVSLSDLALGGVGGGFSDVSPLLGLGLGLRSQFLVNNNHKLTVDEYLAK